MTTETRAGPRKGSTVAGSSTRKTEAEPLERYYTEPRVCLGICRRWRTHLEGRRVVDPFVGAGTTAAAAIAEGRRFIGGDIGARQGDGLPWVTVAHGVLTERSRQVGLFGCGR